MTLEWDDKPVDEVDPDFCFDLEDLEVSGYFAGSLLNLGFQVSRQYLR